MTVNGPNTAQAADSNSECVRFVVGGETLSVRGIEPTKSVLNFVRENLGRKGTKEGCAEGDCGACTVVVGELRGDRVQLRAVNSCLLFVPALDGKVLFTVEDVRQRNGALHPVQQALVERHGSQCGFCTPGFVMSLWSLYVDCAQQDRRPGESEIRTALTGNLCRCTGYKPILEAASAMFDARQVELDRDVLAKQLSTLARDAPFEYGHGGCRFFVPRTVDEVTKLRADHPNATIVAGNTDVGIWVNKQLRELSEIIFVGDVAELREIHEERGILTIGAAASLTDAYAALAREFPQMSEMWERFASVPIRNAGTVGGNVANGSPIGDSMPALIALGADVVLRSHSGTRRLPLEDLYVGYMRKAMTSDEIVASIEVPRARPDLLFRTYKISKRFDSDISIVCAAFAVEVADERIVHCRVAFGGMAATPRRAVATEEALTSKTWNEETARAGMAALASDYAPLTDMRGSASYRLQVAQNLLYRFFVETRPRDPMSPVSVSVYTRA